MIALKSSAQVKVRRKRSLATRQAEETSWQHRFLALLPGILRHAKLRFRSLTPELRDEMVQESIARSMIDYLRLVERGKEHLAYATPLAQFAVLQVRRGRRVGSPMNSRDLSSEYRHGKNGVSLESLDKFDKKSGGWQQVLVEDRHSTPADIAAARIDIGEWLATLPQRNRHIAHSLAIGECTSCVAKTFALSPGRVAQLRRTFEESWTAFQNEC